MKLSSEVRAFCERIRYQFNSPELLVEALTHASFSSPTRADNQRLEFLGDRVLGLVMAEAVLEHDDDASEGVLAPRYNALVRKETCAEVARSVDLGAVMKIGKSEMVSGGRRKNAVLGDGIEAIIAAVYLDGGFKAARTLVLHLWGERIASVDADARDPKTALQELAQARGEGVPTYEIVARSGPDHAPVFTIQVSTAAGLSEQAQAGSKRQAEQQAAGQLLKRLDT